MRKEETDETGSIANTAVYRGIAPFQFQSISIIDVQHVLCDDVIDRWLS